MKKLLLTAALAVIGTAGAHADTLVLWTFDVYTPADSNNSPTITGIAADDGLQANSVSTAFASGTHASGNTDWSTPAGNGSANSLSSNEWAVGDYYQFQLSTVGYENLTLSWDQTGSNTGPKTFTLQYSTDGVNFTTFMSYTIGNLSNGNAISWSGSSAVTTTSFTADLSGITSLANDSSVYFRLVDTSTTSINNGTVATAGTGRVDNFLVSATVIPEPSTYVLLLTAFAGLGAFVWNRKNHELGLSPLSPLFNLYSNVDTAFSKIISRDALANRFTLVAKTLSFRSKLSHNLSNPARGSRDVR